MKLKTSPWARAEPFYSRTADLEKAEIIREKGTNRSKFFRGQIDKYTWVDYGSSYLPSELNAYLWAQLEQSDKIQQDRMDSWNFYNEALRPLAEAEKIQQPFVPDYAVHNAHMYYLKVKDLQTRTRLIHYLGEHGIMAVFHYIPLHTAPLQVKNLVVSTVKIVTLRQKVRGLCGSPCTTD